MKIETSPPFIYTEIIDEDLYCQICVHPLVSPMTHTSCGMTYCSKCIDLTENCPSCGESLKLNIIPAPKTITNMLSKLKISCGLCSSVMCRGDWKDHEENHCPVLIAQRQEAVNKPIHLNLRGTVMTILPKSFIDSEREPENLFKKMFTGEIPMHSTPSPLFTDPVHFIDVDPIIFKHVINWFQNGILNDIPQSERQELQAVCDSFNLYNLKKVVVEKSVDPRFKIDSQILKSCMTNELMSELYLAIGCNDHLPELLYRGSRDGFKAIDFHSRCDYKGPTLTIIKSEHGNIFGGFTSRHWEALEMNEFSMDDIAFLFKIENSKFKKFKVRNQICQQYAIGCGKEDLCVFGAGHDLRIGNDCNLNETSIANIGRTYEAPSGLKYESEEARSYLGGSRKFKVTEIEVFSTSSIGNLVPPMMMMGFF